MTNIITFQINQDNEWKIIKREVVKKLKKMGYTDQAIDHVLNAAEESYSRCGEPYRAIINIPESQIDEINKIIEHVNTRTDLMFGEIVSLHLLIYNSKNS